MIENRESVTAKLCSFARACHSNFEHHKIFDDGLAFSIMGNDEFEETGRLIQHNFDVSKEKHRYHFNRAAVRPVLTRYIMPIPISRIAFAEAELASFIKKHPVCQYVICGAGMRHGYSTAEIGNALNKNGFVLSVHKTPEDIQELYFSNRTDGLSAFENVHFVKAERGKLL